MKTLRTKYEKVLVKVGFAFLRNSQYFPKHQLVQRLLKVIFQFSDFTGTMYIAGVWGQTASHF